MLTGMTIANLKHMAEACRTIHALGARRVLVKGGHLESEDATDLLFDGNTFHTFTSPRIATKNTHGTGCTYSAAIAAFLAKGHNVTTAVERAKAYLTEAIRRALPLGAGHGPLNHYWPFEENGP